MALWAVKLLQTFSEFFEAKAEIENNGLFTTYFHLSFSNFIVVIIGQKMTKITHCKEQKM